MSDRVEIGYVCFKGPHIALVGEDDYGVCGSKSFARVYVTVEVEHRNPRGEEFTAEDAAEEIRRRVAEADAHTWCNNKEDA